MIHIVYLGDSFLANYFNKKRETILKSIKETTDSDRKIYLKE